MKTSRGRRPSAVKKSDRRPAPAAKRSKVAGAPLGGTKRVAGVAPATRLSRKAGASAGPTQSNGRPPPPVTDYWNLRLYVAGQNPRSLSAFANLKRLCDEHLPGRYRIEVIDLMKHPELAKADQVIALPTLVRKLPEPIKRIIGDLSNTDRVRVGMDLVPIVARKSAS